VDNFNAQAGGTATATVIASPVPNATGVLPFTGPANPSATETPTATPLIPASATPIPSNTPQGAPTATTDPAVTPTVTNTSLRTPAPETGDGCTYTVVRGDNPFRIAVNNNITLAELQRANNAIAGINPIIQPGQVLTIPGCGRGTRSITPTPTATQTALPQARATLAPSQPAPDGFEVYVVVSGDTLSAIARRFGTTTTILVRENNIPNPDSLAVGDRILVPLATPTRATSTTPAVTATPAPTTTPAP
jgi:LysM repeat protein